MCSRFGERKVSVIALVLVQSNDQNTPIYVNRMSRAAYLAGRDFVRGGGEPRRPLLRVALSRCVMQLDPFPTRCGAVAFRAF